MVKQSDISSRGTFRGKENKGGNSKGNFRGKENKGGIKFVKSEKRKTPVDDNTKNLRRLYNRLMQKNKNHDKIDIVSKIMKNINGNYSEVCFKHDGCRVLQGSIKYGDKKQRHEIIKCLVPHIYDLITKKYSIYLAIKIFKFAEPKQREEIVIQSILPNFNKLIKSANGQLILNFIFSNSPNNLQNKLVEFYIEKILKIPETRLQALSTVNMIIDQPANEMIIVEKQGTFDQENTRNDVKTHLEKQLEKAVHKNFVFQGFLNKIFDYMDAKTKLYITELFDDDLNEFLNNKHGIELACKIFTVANAKTRKKIIKKVKDSINSLLSNEQSVIFLIKIIFFNDDTKLIEKYILKTLVEHLNDEIMQNKIIMKIFMNIITPFNSRVNTQYENKILQYNQDTSSKKNDEKRHDEILSFTLDDIFRVVNLNIKFFVGDAVYSTMFIEMFSLLNKKNDEEKLKELLKNLLALIEMEYNSNNKDINSTLLSEKNTHFVINRVLKIIGTNLTADFKMTFFQGLAKILLNNFEEFLNSKAIFLILTIVENSETKKLLEKDVKKHKNFIISKSQEKGMIGFQLLNKILN